MPEVARPRHYDFGHGFQVKLLGMCCRKASFLIGFRDVLRVEWFPDDTKQDMARIILDYFDRFRTAPSIEVVREEVAMLLSSDSKRGEKAEEYASLLDGMEHADLVDDAYLTDRVCKFARKRAVVEAFRRNVEDMDRDEFDAMEARLRAALAVGTSKTDLGINYFSDEKRFEYNRVTHTISTGLRHLDHLLEGGTAPGELFVLEAPTGSFKSGGLVNFGTAALLDGCDVVHMSHEIKAPQVARRYDGALLGKVTKNHAPEHIQKMLREKQEEIGQRLWIRSWPIGTAGVSDMRAYVHTLASEGHILTGKRRLLLICDYGQIIKPARHYSEKRYEIRENYQGLIQMADEFGAPIGSAVQTNRAAENKTLITRVDIAECYAMAGDAHIILSQNQTRDERDRNEMRLFIAKSRETEDFRHVDLIVDREMTRWKEAMVQSGMGAFTKDIKQAQAEAKKVEEKRRDDDHGFGRNMRIIGE